MRKVARRRRRREGKEKVNNNLSDMRKERRE